MKKIIGFILNLVSSVCMLIFVTCSFPISFILTWWNRDLTYTLNRLNEQQESIAITKDVLLGIMLAPLLNLILIKKSAAVKFGVFPQTISYVLGMGYLNGCLTKFGRFWVKFLNNLDKEHCLNAVRKYNEKHNINIR